MKIQKLIVLFIFLAGIFLTGCDNNRSKLDTDVVKNDKSANKSGVPGESARIIFKKTEHDFGKIISGEFVRYSYKFTNTGKGDLLITNVKTSCGCTVPSYPRKPIKSGESDQIEVIFDTRGRKGIQNKSITVLSNAIPNKTVLRFKANIVQPEKN